MATDGSTLVGWSCAVCTLVNLPEAARCVACEGLRPGHGGHWANSSGVVVVVPPERSPEAPSAERGKRVNPGASENDQRTCKRPKQEDGTGHETGLEEGTWACTACTLLNVADAMRCLACEGLRMVPPAATEGFGHAPGRAVSAAALRAARRGNDRETEAARSGVASGPRPVEEWASLPPAPDGHVLHRLATDDDLDIFGQTTEETAVDATGTCASAHGVDVVDDAHTPGPARKLPRPVWGTGGSPVFALLGAQAPDISSTGVDEAVLFEDAVARLSTCGFDPTKCHLALEAAGGDESLAREFLVRET